MIILSSIVEGLIHDLRGIDLGKGRWGIISNLHFTVLSEPPLLKDSELYINILDNNHIVRDIHISACYPFLLLELFHFLLDVNQMIFYYTNHFIW